MSEQSQGVAVIIPARLESTRFPKKLLQPVPDPDVPGGRKILLQLTYEAAELAFPSCSFVATDSDEIAAAVTAFGGRVLRTGQHDNGTRRVAEAATLLSSDFHTIINVQGDEPEIDPGLIQHVARYCKSNPIATAACQFQNAADWLNNDIVKVITDWVGRAIYFSRAPIPWGLDTSWGVPSAGPQRHIGVYAFQREMLKKIARHTGQTSMEKWERLEQLTWLYWGWPIAVAHTDTPHHGIDTHADYAGLVNRLAQRQAARGQTQALADTQR